MVDSTNKIPRLRHEYSDTGVIFSIRGSMTDGYTAAKKGPGSVYPGGLAVGLGYRFEKMPLSFFGEWAPVVVGHKTVLSGGSSDLFAESKEQTIMDDHVFFSALLDLPHLGGRKDMARDFIAIGVRGFSNLSQPSTMNSGIQFFFKARAPFWDEKSASGAFIDLGGGSLFNGDFSFYMSVGGEVGFPGIF